MGIRTHSPAALGDHRGERPGTRDAEVRERNYQDGSGAAWRFLTAAPGPALAPYVQYFWEVHGTVGLREKVLPMADVSVIVNLGAPHRLIGADNETVVSLFRNAWVSGLQRRHLITSAPRGVWLCGARLTPQGAFRLLGHSPASLADRVVDLDALFASSAATLVDRLRSAPDARTRFIVMAAAARSRLALAPDWDREVRWAVGALTASQGGAPIAVLAAELGWSRQMLHKRFIDQVGQSPKLFARLLRFGEAVRAIGANPRPDLVRVAQDSGFFDQPHLNRDFREFAGVAPGEYLGLRLPDSELGFARCDRL